MFRHLIALLSLLAALAFAEEPLLRVGLVTDTHVGKTKASCRYVESTLKLFRQQNVELIVNLGDIADHHYVTGYQFYREIFNDTFKDAPRRPQEIYLYANHDRLDMPDIPTAWASLKENLQVPNDPFGTLVCKGYTFVYFPQNTDMKRFEADIAAAVAANPDKPVFVLDHIPPRMTTYDTGVWGASARRSILNKFPSVIHLSGHVHNSLYNELCIWQGEFTAINAGSLHYWEGCLTGEYPKSKRAFEVMVMDVFKDKVIFHRYDLSDNMAEIKSNQPWTVPLPFDPKTAPYKFETRKAADVPPQFANDAKLSISTDSPFTRLSLDFPEAKHPDTPFLYKIQLERKNDQGTYVPFARKDQFSDFYLPPGKRTDKRSNSFDAGYFEEGKSYRLTVTPCDFFDNGGKPLTAEFTAPAHASAKTIFESSDPMKECPFMGYYDGGKPMPLKDGYYQHNLGVARLCFPQDLWKEFPKGSKFRFTTDLQMIQPGPGNWTCAIRNHKPVHFANSRLNTLGGDPGPQRIVIVFEKRYDDANNYTFILREGDNGKVRFDHVKIELLNNGTPLK